MNINNTFITRSVFASIIFFVMIILIEPRSMYAEGISVTVSAMNDSDSLRQAKPIRYHLPPEIGKEDILDTAGMELRYDETKSTFYLFDKVDLEPGAIKEYKIIFDDVWAVKDQEIDLITKQLDTRLEFMKDTDDYPMANKYAENLKQRLESIRQERDTLGDLEVQDRIELSRIHNENLDSIRHGIMVMGDFVKEARWFEARSEETGSISFVINIKNPYENARKNVLVQKYLPGGVRKQQVLDDQGLDVKFDPAKMLYYVTGRVDLQPKENRKITIKIKNIWRVPNTRLDDMSVEAEALLLRLEKTQYFDTGQNLTDDINTRVGEIKKIQEESESPLDIIANYAMNMKRYTSAEDSLSQLRKLVNEIEHYIPQTVPYYTKPVTPDVSTTWNIIYGMIGVMTVIALLTYFLWFGQSKKSMNKTFKTYEPE